MEYKIISSNFRYRHKEKRNTEVSVKTVSYNKYNQFLISAIKGITKNHEIILKDYESLFYSMKDQFKKNSHYILGDTFQFPNIGRESPAFMI